MVETGFRSLSSPIHTSSNGFSKNDEMWVSRVFLEDQAA